jgi:hypothetical protein
MNTTVRDLIRAARRAGWRITHTGSGHIKLTPPAPKRATVVIASTPSDRRAWRNILADIRKAGLRLP